ncbi:MAG: flagellar biosynthetic protein FliP, partial [Lysobacterales bacterium]
MSGQRLMRLLQMLLAVLAISLGADALAAPPTVTLPPMPDVTVATVGTQTVSLPLQILALMTVITLLPGILLAMTAFTRIIVVLALLRQALGTGQTPSNQILLA